MPLGFVAGSQNFAKVKKDVLQFFESEIDLVDYWLAKLSLVAFLWAQNIRNAVQA